MQSRPVDIYLPNIHIARSYAEHDIGSLSDSGRTKRFRQKSPPWSFNVPYIWQILLGALCGCLVLVGGIGLCLIAYYSTFPTPNNSTSTDIIETQHNMTTTGYSGVRSFSIIGPIFMAFGFFIIMIAYVIYMELRDKYYRFLPTEKIKHLPEKQIFELILQQFRRSYFHGVSLPIGKPSAATNTYPAGIHNAENTDELLERLSPRFERAEREADEALRIPHDSEVTLAYLAHVPGNSGDHTSGFTTAFVNKNLYSPFNIQKGYNKSLTQKSTPSLKYLDKRTQLVKNFSERKSYSLDVPKPKSDGSHENLAFEDEQPLPPATSLRRLSASRAISSDNDSNLSDSRYPSVIVHEAAVHRRASNCNAAQSLDIADLSSVRRPSTFGVGLLNKTDKPLKTKRRFSEFGVGRPKKTRAKNRRQSAFGAVGLLDQSNTQRHDRRRSEFGILGAIEQPPSMNRRCSAFGIIGVNPQVPQYATENSMDTDSSTQSAYQTIVNIAPAEEIKAGTFTGRTGRRKSLISQCSVCNNDILIDLDEYESTNPVKSEPNSVCASKLSIDQISNEFLLKPSVEERRSSFRKTHSKGNTSMLLEPPVDTSDRRHGSERRVSFDPRTPCIERSRSCSSKLSIDETQTHTLGKLGFMSPRPDTLRPPSSQGLREFALMNASSGSIDRSLSSVSPRRNFLSPSDLFDDNVFNSQRDLRSPSVHDNRQSASDLHRSFNYTNKCEQAPSLSERRGSFDPRSAYAQSSAHARRKSFVGSDSDSMEYRISIDRVDDNAPRRSKRRGRSLQVRSSRSKTKHLRNKTIHVPSVSPKSSITFKCGIEEIRHHSFSMSQDDGEPLRKSTVNNFLTPDYQPR